MALGTSALGVYYGSTPAGDAESARTTVVVVGARHTLCSGVIVGSRTVLTAAHCAEQSVGKRAAPLRVYFPLKYERVTLERDLDPERVREVTAVTRMDERERAIALNDNPSQARADQIKTLPDDIAVLSIAGLYNADGRDENAPAYRAATLATPKTNWKPDQPMTIAGYGLDETRGLGVLHEGELRYVFRLAIGARPMIVLQSRADVYAPKACNGDSGGGVFMHIASADSSTDQNPVVIGVLSAILPYSSDPSLQTKLRAGSQLSPQELCQLERVLVMDVRQYGALLRRAAVNDPVLTQALTRW